jgi:glycosyltransferase involved in cell wall biosynthesis
MDKIVYNIASYKRADTLINTINSIYNQCDIINLTLNDYDEIPVELFDKKINLFISDNDKGDAYKFYNLINSEGYFFTIDDDLIYPENYSDYMIGKIEEYKRKSFITIHGRNFNNPPIKSYYSDKNQLFHFNQLLNKDVKVQFGGTGVMAFHTDLFKVSMDYFREPNMADVWVGKYAIENNIDIICVRHNSGFVTQQTINDSIYSSEYKSDLKQTVLTNDALNDKKISIIIPTYDNVEYLKECVDSVILSCGDSMSFEVLIGIDNCEKTLNYVNQNKFNPNIKFYYFNENVGPYVIKNTLSLKSKSKNLLFFDSDDIMDENMVNEIINKLTEFQCVKPRFHNFSGEFNLEKIKLKKEEELWGEGVFGIHKEILLNLNGFEGWRCAADSDFMGRIQKNGIKINSTKSILFYRRLHSKGLTSDPKTNFGSSLRKEYVQMSKDKKYFGPLDELKTSEFIVIYNRLDFTNIKRTNENSNQKVISKIDKTTNNKTIEVIEKLDKTSSVRVVDSKNPEIKKYVKPVEEKVLKPEPIVEFKMDETNISNNNVRQNVLSLLSSNNKIVRKADVGNNKDVIINRRNETKPIEKPNKTNDQPKLKPLKGKFGFNF